MIIQIVAFVLLVVFYITHIGKKMRMKRKNTHIDLLADKANKGKTATVQMALKTVTYITMTVQFASVLFAKYVWSLPAVPTMQEDGVILMAVGVAFFIIAMTTMNTDWRAGYKKGQGTNLVTHGIYKFSRNPAFVGFDLLYIGCALTFPNPFNIAAALMSIVMFHIQILGEEKFLAETFGQEYIDYKAKTMRYLGRRK